MWLVLLHLSSCATLKDIKRLETDISVVKIESSGVDTIMGVGAILGLILIGLSYPVSRYLRYKIFKQGDL